MTAQEFIERVFSAGVIDKPRLAEYGEKISDHLTAGVDNIWSPDTREVVLYKPMIRLFEKAREFLGRPIPVTAGYRTLAHEHALQQRGYKTVKFVSPHCFGAMDLDARPYGEKSEKSANLEIQACLVSATKHLNLPRPRLGHKAYHEKFTHVDLVFMLFQPFTSLPHPAAWPELDEGTRKALGASWREGVEW